MWWRAESSFEAIATAAGCNGAVFSSGRNSFHDRDVSILHRAEVQCDAMLLRQHGGAGCNDLRAGGRQGSYELVRGARDQPRLGDHLGIGGEKSSAMLHQLAADPPESVRECH